jgi:phage baseplate assembly protein W
MPVGLNVKGVARPFRFGPRGHANRVEKEARIKQNLEGIALTKKGERLREKDFGTVGYDLIFRNLTEARLHLIENLVADAIVNYEPRALLHDITSSKEENPDGSQATVIKVQYEIPELPELDMQLGEAKIGAL